MEGFGKLQKMGCGGSVPHMKDGGYVSKARAEEDQGFKATKKAVGGAISIIDAVGKPVGGAVAPGKPSAKDRRAAMKLKPKVSVEIPLAAKKGGGVKKCAVGGAVDEEQAIQSIQKIPKGAGATSNAEQEKIRRVLKSSESATSGALSDSEAKKIAEAMRQERDEARELKLMEDAYNKAGGELKFAKGGAVKESAKDEKAETKKIAAISKGLKSHEKLPASKGHKGLKCGGKVKRMAEGGMVDPYETFNAAFESANGIPKSHMTRGKSMYDYYNTISSNGGYKVPSAAAGVPAFAGGSNPMLSGWDKPAPASVSSSTETPQEMMTRRLSQRANPTAGNPQTVDPSGKPAYFGGGSQTGQALALMRAQAALPTTSKLYKPEQQYHTPGQVAPDPIDGGNGGFGPMDPSKFPPPSQVGGPLGFLNQYNQGQNKYMPQRPQVMGNRLGYPQQNGGAKFERPSQQNELQQTGRFAGMPKVNYGGSNTPGMAGTMQLSYLNPETGSYGAYPGSPQFPTGERDDDPGTAPGWVRPQAK